MVDIERAGQVVRAVAITQAQMQALERMTLSQYCERVSPLVSPNGRADPEILDRIAAVVTFLAAFGVRMEADVEPVLVACWPRGRAALETPELRDILTDDERPGWLKSMQILRLLEAARG